MVQESATKDTVTTHMHLSSPIKHVKVCLRDHIYDTIIVLF